MNAGAVALASFPPYFVQPAFPGKACLPRMFAAQKFTALNGGAVRGNDCRRNPGAVRPLRLPEQWAAAPPFSVEPFSQLTRSWATQVRSRRRSGLRQAGRRRSLAEHGLIIAYAAAARSYSEGGPAHAFPPLVSNTRGKAPIENRPDIQGAQP